MSTFADSSALVTLYAEETGGPAVHGAAGLIVSSLVRVEVPSALWRKQRDGALAPEDAALLTGLFEADYLGEQDDRPRLLSVTVSASILEEAARLTATHSLRALDAVQLATALAARRADPECTAFACLDVRLRAAAAGTGFALVPQV